MFLKLSTLGSAEHDPFATADQHSFCDVLAQIRGRGAQDTQTKPQSGPKAAKTGPEGLETAAKAECPKPSAPDEDAARRGGLAAQVPPTGGGRLERFVGARPSGGRRGGRRGREGGHPASLLNRRPIPRRQVAAPHSFVIALSFLTNDDLQLDYMQRWRAPSD